MSTQDASEAWMQDPNGRGIAFDGSALIVKGVHLTDELRQMLLDAFHQAVRREREGCANLVEGCAGRRGLNIGGVDWFFGDPDDKPLDKRAADTIASAIRSKSRGAGPESI